jgi:hypothetical protein
MTDAANGWMMAGLWATVATTYIDDPSRRRLALLGVALTGCKLVAMWIAA